jgi:hypothetical protein
VCSYRDEKHGRIPDELYRAKAEVALRGCTFNDLVEEGSGA